MISLSELNYHYAHKPSKTLFSSLKCVCFCSSFVNNCVYQINMEHWARGRLFYLVFFTLYGKYINFFVNDIYARFNLNKISGLRMGQSYMKLISYQKYAD